jgi:ribosome-associated protein
LNSTDLAHRISDIIFTKKGFNVLAIDLRNLVSFTDYFVICSADSDTQVKAIADEVDKILREGGKRARGEAQDTVRKVRKAMGLTEKSRLD